MLCKETFSLMSRILVISIFLTGFSAPVLSQGYIVEIHGTWKKSNGSVVGNRQRVSAETRIDNASGQSSDSIFIAGEDGRIVAYCSNGCTSLVVPTQSWGEYLWCKMIGCKSKKYLTIATKGDECVNFDGIAVIDRNGVTDLAGVLKLFSNKSDKLSLKFQRNMSGNIEEKIYDIESSNPQIEDLQIGFYDILEGDFSSRVLILPNEIYELEKQSFAEIQDKIASWKEKGLSNCTIKTFTQSYVDFVTKKYKSKLKKIKKKTKT